MLKVQVQEGIREGHYYGQKSDPNQYSRTRDITNYPAHSSSLNLVPTLPTLQFSQWVTSLEANLSDYTQLPLERQKGLDNFFQLQYAVVLPNTCKHTLMCKIVGVTL